MKHNYQLHRVIPKLSGDVKIDILIDSTIKNNQEHTDILKVGVSPVYYGDYNSYVDDKDNNDYLEGKFKNLVELYSDKLYGISNQENDSTPYFDKYLAGTFRTRCIDFHNKSTHCTLIPLWLADLKKTSSIQVILKVLNNGNELIRKVINLTKNQYIKQYLDTRIVGDGINNNKKQGIYIDHINRKCIVYGYSLKESTVCRVETDDLYQVLFCNRGERPHIGTMSVINNWFADNNLILPPLINFGIHFDINTLIGGLSEISSYQQYQVETQVIIDNKKLPFKDFYTNFDYIPAYVAGKNKGYFEQLSPNILEDSSKDFNEHSNLLYANQFDQRLVHWTYTEGSTVGGKNGNPELIFNISTGFKNVRVGAPKDVFGNNKFVPIPGNGYGSNTGQTVDKYEESTHNIQWAGQVMYGSMNKCIEVLNNIDYYINENSGNFLSLIGNNNKSDIYLGLMTTPSENGVELDFYGTTPHAAPLKDKKLYKELIPFEFTGTNIPKSHGLNDLKPRVYFRLDKIEGNRYREVWLVWAPHVVRPEDGTDKADIFDKLGYKQCKPDYLTQGKVLKLFRTITGSVDGSGNNSGNNSLTPEQQYYNNWWNKSVQDGGTNKLTQEYPKPQILGALEDYGLLFSIPITKGKLDYYINYNNVVNGNINYNLYHNDTGFGIQSTQYINRLGGYIIPLFSEPNDHIIKTTSTTIKYFNKPGLNFVYFKDISPSPAGGSNNDIIVTKMDSFKKVGYGSQQYFPRKNVNILVLNTKEVPGFLKNSVTNENQLMEYRWFNQGGSSIIPLPKMVKIFNQSKTEVDKYLETMDNKKWYSTKVYHSDNDNNMYHIIRELI